MQNKNKLATDICYVMDKPQKHFTNWFEARYRIPHTVWFQLFGRKNKFMEKESRLVVIWGWRLTVNGHEGSCWGDENVPKLIYSKLYYSVKLLEITELHVWNGWILCYIKYTSINLFIKKKYKLAKLFVWKGA